MKWPKLAKEIAFEILWIVGNTIKLLFFKVTLEGKEHVPRRGAYLLVSNHQSYLDPVAVHVVSRRRLNFLMASEYYYDWRFRWFYDLFNCIPIDRSRVNPKPMEKALKMMLKGNEPLAVFPEGGIPDDDKLAVFQPGIGWLALKTKLPILPVLIKGTRDVLPYGKYFPRLKPVEIYIGKLFSVKQESESLSKREIHIATQRIRNNLLQLAREKDLYEYFLETQEGNGSEP